MYERPCYQKLDQPVIVWLGLEFKEITAAFGAGAAVAILTGFILGLGLPGMCLGVGVGFALVVLFRFLRSGGPGSVFARLYRAGLFEALPAAFRPRHLLPIPKGGRGGRFQLSPILEKEEVRGNREAFRYFGR